MNKARQRWRGFLVAGLSIMLTATTIPPDYHSAAQELDEIIASSYAYLDKLPGGSLPDSPVLRAEREAVSDRDSLLRYAEHRIASLADHHAITGSSFNDSWAVIPTYADLWIVLKEGRYVVDSVQDASPAMAAGVRAGDQLIAVDGRPAAGAVAAYWGRLGLAVTPQRAQYAARVLAAGRRDRDRRLTFANKAGETRALTLPSLYRRTEKSNLLTVTHTADSTTIRFNNSLGNPETIAAFDSTLATLPANRKIVLDLRDTPSGGNTTVARAVMGWFVDKPTGYQVHVRPDEERQTGIARQWIEQVLPRAGRHRLHMPTVMVGRWTGSMGEGIAIGFAVMGAAVVGTPMAGLNGSVEDLPIGTTGLSIKLPTERLLTTQYLPREDFIPALR